MKCIFFILFFICNTSQALEFNLGAGARYSLLSGVDQALGYDYTFISYLQPYIITELIINNVHISPFFYYELERSTYLRSDTNVGRSLDINSEYYRIGFDLHRDNFIKNDMKLRLYIERTNLINLTFSNLQAYMGRSATNQYGLQIDYPLVFINQYQINTNLTYSFEIGNAFNLKNYKAKLILIDYHRNQKNINWALAFSEITYVYEDQSLTKDNLDIEAIINF